MAKKKLISTRIDEDLIKSLKHLAIDLDKSIAEILEMAIRDVIKKHEPEKTQPAIGKNKPG